MSKIKLTPNEYQNLKLFLDFFSTRFFYTKAMTAENNLMTALAEMEKKTPARAVDALSMMINDCLEMSSDWRAEKVAPIDSELKVLGIITLTELRHQYSKQYARVIKRGKINSEEEYYLLKGILDGQSLEMTETEEETLNLILTSYEDKIPKRKA